MATETATETKHFDWQRVWKAAEMVARDAIAQRWLDYRGEVALAILDGNALSEIVLSPSATLRNGQLGKLTAAALLETEPERIVDIQIAEAGNWDVTYLPVVGPPKPIPLIMLNKHDRYPKGISDVKISCPETVTTDVAADVIIWAIEWERDGERATGTLTTRAIKDLNGDMEDRTNWLLYEYPFEGNAVGCWPRRGRLEQDKPLEVFED